MRHPRFFAALAAAVLFVVVLCAVAARAADVPPGTPPDIAAIMRKIQAGGQPTGADIAKLVAWSKRVTEKLNNPSATAPTAANPHPALNTTLQGIPCQVMVTVSYDGTGGGEHETCSLSVTALAQLIPRIDGTGDYFSSIMDPSAHVSSFQFALPLTNGKLAKTGSGTFMQRITGKSSEVITGTYENTVASFTLATTGRGDDLYGTGGVGGALQGTETATAEDGRTTTYHIVSGGGHGTPSVSVPFAAEAAGKAPKPGKPTAAPAMHLSYRQLVAAIQSGKTQSVGGTERFTFARGGRSYSGTVAMTITLRPKALRLIVEPADAVAYKEWVPMPDADECNESAFFGTPKPLQVHLVLQDPSKSAAAKPGTPTKPNVTIGGKITMSLSDVSSEPGLCMNYPRDGATKDGLFFPKKQPAGIAWIDDKHLETESATAMEATVNVAARDTAAYGNIQAECPSLGLHSIYPEKQTPVLSLPLDDNGNHIADQWEIEKGIKANNYGPDWDAEDEPSGWATKGDGLSLFEEYRGFLVEPADSTDEKFVRLIPGKRKLFVYPVGADKTHYKAGAQRFSENIGVDTYFLHNAVRLKSYGNQAYDTWMNFNKTPFTLIKQCAIRMVDNGPVQDSPGVTVTEFTTLQYQAMPQCPQNIYYVNISRDECQQMIDGRQANLPPMKPLADVFPSYKAAATATGRDLLQVGNAIARNKPALVNLVLEFIVMHELGHTIGGCHHDLARYLSATPAERQANDGQLQDECYSSGDHACIMRYWQADPDHAETLLFLDGTWKLTTPYAGGKWTLCDSADRPNLRIKP